MNRNRPLTQVYEAYTAEDLKVWRILFDKQTRLLNRYASKVYLEALATVGFDAGAIPRFTDIDEILAPLTGWRLAVVPGHVPPKDFFDMLADRVFPATCWLRTFQELDYIEEPDMFHDVFGHVPLLANPEYAAFMQSFGQLALKWHDDPHATDILSRIYWFTIEFGLIREGGASKIYGAGILSSPGETGFSMSDTPRKSSFDIREVMNTGFRTDAIQEEYFIIDNYADLAAALPEVDRRLRMESIEMGRKLSAILS